MNESQSAMGTENTAHGAAEAVRRLRAAIQRQDVEAAQRERWLAPRPMGERDLLSDMAAAEGLEVAVRRLAKFWDRATVVLEHVRTVSKSEVEVYERLSLPAETLTIMSLVRREREGAPWQVVCTNEAKDERFSLWLSVRRPVLDDVAWSRRPDAPGDLLMDGDQGVLGHGALGWLIHLRGPRVPEVWPDGLPGEGGRVLELLVAITPNPDERGAQLEWVYQAAHGLAQQLEAESGFIPTTGRLVHLKALEAAAQGLMTSAQALRFWVQIQESGEYLCTEGLGQLGLPEAEVRLDALSSPELARQVLEWFATTLLEPNGTMAIGTELVIGDESLLVAPGRRGPLRGRSYGRCGAIGLVPSKGRVQRGSRTRMRVPVNP